MKTGKKIVMVVASAFPANHGTPASIIDMCNQLIDAGHDVCVTTYSRRDYDESFRFPVFRVPSGGRDRSNLAVGPSWIRLWYDFLLVYTTARVVFKFKPDVIHAHNYEGQLIGWLVALLTRRPVVYHAHNTMIDELPQYEGRIPKSMVRIFARTLDYIVPRTADHVVAISSNLKRFLISKGIREDKITQIPLFVSCDIFSEQTPDGAARKYNLPAGKKIIYTGTLDKFQRIDYLIEAFREIQAGNEPVSLVLVVNRYKEEQLEECKQLCRDMGVWDSVCILLETDMGDLLSLIKACDVAVVPRPDCPGFPIKIINYMAAGLPIAAFSGTADFLEDRRNALLAEGHDVVGLSENISTLLMDDFLRNRLGETAEEDLNNFWDSGKIVADLREVYEGASV